MAIARVLDERDTRVMRELTYRSRHVWVTAKGALGLPCRNDKNYFIDRFSRLLRSGTVGRDCKIMAVGKDDGVGSQAQAAMSAICFAEAHGLEYIHRPFTRIAHPEGRMHAWVRQWEDYFNLGQGARRAAACTAASLPVEDVLRGERAWSDDTIVTAEHYLHYCNQDREAWERMLPALRRKYRHNKPVRAPGPFTIAVHMRRGDVTAEDKTVARNFTPNLVFFNTLSQIKQIVSMKLRGARIQVFSQGSPDMFRDLAALGCELHLNESALATHRQLVEADVLVMSKGAFSYTAGVLNEGIALYDPQKYRALDDWIVRTRDGSFDRAEFSARLDVMLARRSAGAMRAAV